MLAPPPLNASRAFLHRCSHTAAKPPRGKKGQDCTALVCCRQQSICLLLSSVRRPSDLPQT